MWRHNHAHEHSSDYLLALMAQNKFFAEVCFNLENFLNNFRTMEFLQNCLML